MQYSALILPGYTAAPICHTSAIGRSLKDSGSCIHLFASWLL